MPALTLVESFDNADGAVGSNDDFESPHEAVTTATTKTNVHLIGVRMTERELQPTFRAISAEKLGLHVLHVP